jgi:hypothetical protein
MNDHSLEPAAEYVAAVTFTFRLPGCYYSARSAGEYAAVLLADGVLAGQEQDRSVAVAPVAEGRDRYESREDLAGKADWEGTAELLFSYGLDPSELPEGTPADVTAAVTRLVTQAAADLRTFSEWLQAGEGLS